LEKKKTNASVVEEAEVGFDYSAEAELFPAAIGNRGDNQLGTDVLRTLRTPPVSRSRSFRLNFFSEPISKSTRRDTTAREFVGCTKAWTIPWSAAEWRSHSKSVVFSHSFELKDADRILPPGDIGS
jgi:hypothetical protein